MVVFSIPAKRVLVMILAAAIVIIGISSISVYSDLLDLVLAILVTVGGIYGFIGAWYMHPGHLGFVRESYRDNPSFPSNPSLWMFPLLILWVFFFFFLVLVFDNAFDFERPSSCFYRLYASSSQWLATEFDMELFNVGTSVNWSWLYG